MTEEQKQALIERILNIKTSGKANRFEITELAEIALSALTAQPDSWQQRAEAAEAKLAELEKQDPYGYADPKAIERMINGYTRFYTVKPERSVRNRLPVFINPAPAINLAELVPEGWKLVPVEPSWRMISAAIKHHEGDAFLPVSLYKTMLAAAPEVE